MEKNTQWTILGPGGGGGHFIPTISPHNPDKVLEACDMTGAYITNDGGKTWREFNLRARVDSYTFDPVRPNVVYAGSSGLFRSDDGGERWRLILPTPDTVVGEQMLGDEADHFFMAGDSWPGGKVRAIMVDGEQPDHIYAGVINGKTIYVFFSATGGGSWMELCRLPGQRLHKLVLDLDSPVEDRLLLIFTDQGVYRGFTGHFTPERIKLPRQISSITNASWGTEPATGKIVLYMTTPSIWEKNRGWYGVWRSFDMGQRWERLRDPFTDRLAPPQPGQMPVFGLIAACEGDGRVVYLSVREYPEKTESSDDIVKYFGIMKTEDGGESWRWVLKGDINLVNDPENKKLGWVERNFGPETRGIGPKGAGAIGLGVCPSHPEICYVTDMGVTYRTLDGGENWEQVYSNDHCDGTFSSRGMDVTTCYGVHFDPFDREHIVISYTDIGMLHSRNGGKTWKHSVTGVPVKWSNTCYWMVFDPEVRGRAWSVWGYAHDLPRAKMYFGGGHTDRYPGGVCRTDDGAETWQVTNAGMPANSVSTHIVLDPDSPAGCRTLYVAVFDRGVYKSVDDGRTWVLKNQGLGKNLYAWRFTRFPDGTLYLLMSRGRKDGVPVAGCIYRSTDGAEHWEKVPMPEGADAPNDLVFDPRQPQRMYLACWPKPEKGENRCGGLYITEDGGETWQNIFDTSAYCYAALVDPENPDTIFLTTFNSAAYRSDDRGKTWERLKGYTFKWAHRPILDPYNKGMLYITTFGSSVWYGPSEGMENAFEDIEPWA